MTVFKPVHSGSTLMVPVKITNHGDQRAFYEVAVRVTGTNGFDVTVHMKTDVVGVHPGASWPTELTAKDPRSPVPETPIFHREEYEINASQLIARCLPLRPPALSPPQWIVLA
ncbi:hypothetical protein ACFW9V_33260, partial [Streptomyces hygroscopicus]|uniref:hypothetical protein n=1 Tax=Streptomyces hygroscopicus TaxID=1912 RepID=UPI0036CED269